jgi:DNA polymerase-1
MEPVKHSNKLMHKAMLEGIEIFTRFNLDTKEMRLEDSLIVSYLAVNSTAGNELGLKKLAQEFAGNWAVDTIDDITRIPANKLLQYNLIDCLSSCYVYNKYYPIMVNDQQEDIYKQLMLPSLWLILQTQLSGMPINMDKVYEVEKQFDQSIKQLESNINSMPIVKTLTHVLQVKEMEKANAKLKVKQHPLSHFANYSFNPNSNTHLQEMLYRVMALPVIDLTEGKEPACGAKTLAKLINHTSNPDYKQFIAWLIELKQISKIQDTFIPAFKDAHKHEEGNYTLHGFFNIGGTVSGRLSSSEPNLQNLPAGSKYGKLIKKCFQSSYPNLFVGADFNSLEDYVSALTTKDPNKLKVYVGHDVYELIIDGICHHIRDDAIICYEGINYSGEEFYAKYADSQLPP